MATGLSPAVETRWFRESGGMPPFTFAPLSDRYLSFAEREKIATLHAQGCGVRAIARFHLDLPDVHQPLEQSLLVSDVVNLDQLDAVGDAGQHAAPMVEHVGRQLVVNAEPLAREPHGCRDPQRHDHEQQNHRAKTATDAVEKRESRDPHFTPAPRTHGQSNDGLMNEPLVLRASFQKESGA